MKQRTFDAEEKAWPLYRTSRCGAITVEVMRDGEIHVRPFLRARIGKLLRLSCTACLHSIREGDGSSRAALVDADSARQDLAQHSLSRIIGLW